MSSNIITTIGINGISAKSLTLFLDEIRLKIPRESKFSSDALPHNIQVKVNSLIKYLFEITKTPPVFYFAQHLDGWSVAGSNFHLYKWPNDIFKIMKTNEHTIAYYTNRDFSTINKQYKSQIKNEFLKRQIEDKWYLQSINECRLQVSWIKTNSIIISFSSFIGTSIMNEDYKDSLSYDIFKLPVAQQGDAPEPVTDLLLR